jgi:hypothetical protein
MLHNIIMSAHVTTQKLRAGELLMYMLHNIFMPAHANHSNMENWIIVYVNVTKDYLACSCSKSQRSEELDKCLCKCYTRLSRLLMQITQTTRAGELFM